MKKIINIILGIALVISLCGNIYLIKLTQETKGQVEVYSSSSMVEVDGQIVGWQEKVADLERQLLDKEGEIKKLEDVIAETVPTPSPTPTEVTNPQDDIGNGAGQQLTESETTYLEEAKNLWAQSDPSSLECNEETFTEAYIGLRDSKSKEEAYTEVLDTFKKEEPQPTPAPTVEPQQQQTQQPQQNQSTGTMPTRPDGGGVGVGGNSATGSGDGASAGRTGGLE